MQGNNDRRTDELIPSFRPVTYAALLRFNHKCRIYICLHWIGVWSAFLLIYLSEPFCREEFTNA